ncbi:MAG TPA: HEAT repeat domain-containing protein [Kiritimatiellia bacterium]|jgi:hypothetical protein|nr:HEAT repeat domain-containing protein [Kiritimatiellia bacterium]HOR98489.1 HEAT repeat domain-containing protein [Kiritimatiellia bacterium]
MGVGKREKGVFAVGAGVLVLAAGIAAFVQYRRVPGASSGGQTVAVPDAAETAAAGSGARATTGKPVRSGSVRGGGSSLANAAQRTREREAKRLASPSPTNEVPLTPEQKLAATMEERLDNGDERGALELARQLLKAESSEVRSDVVTTLGWIGVKALPELSVMLGDADSEVSEEALQQWIMAIEEIEDPHAKAQMLALAMRSTRDEDTLQSIAMEFNGLPEDVVLRSLQTIIQGQKNGPAVDVAREEYESITGEEYSTPEALEKYILENVEPEDEE